MRLRAIIIDDEQTGIDTLKLLLEKYITDVKVVAQTTAGKEAIELIENYMPEIVFLDISMPEMDAFELLEKLTWKNFNLVFTTAHQEYGLKALKGGAVDYLLKPIDHKDLKIAVDKIKTKVIEQKIILAEIGSIPTNNLKVTTSKIAVSSKYEIEYLELDEIVSLESKSNYTTIHLVNGNTLLTPRTLKDYEIQLCHSNSRFIRVHNSFIINVQKVLRYIKDVDDIIMVTNQKIPLSKSRRDIFLKWLEN